MRHTPKLPTFQGGLRSPYSTYDTVRSTPVFAQLPIVVATRQTDDCHADASQLAGYSPQRPESNLPTARRILRQPKSIAGGENRPFSLSITSLAPVPVLDVSRVNHDSQQHPYGIHDDVTLASHHLLTSVKATRPPFSVVLTDWLSMIAALVGVHSLPSARRTSGRRASWTCSQMPSLFHLRKYWYTVCHGGKSCGSIRHGQPVRRT